MSSAPGQQDRVLSLLLFTRSFAVLLQGGISLMTCLELLNQEAPPPYDAVARDLRDPIGAGHTLSGTMAARPERFSSLYTTMVRVGEIGGILDEVMLGLADLLEEEWKWIAWSGSDPGPTFLSPSGALQADDWEGLSATARRFVLMLFCRSLSTLLTAGVPRSLALKTAADLLPATQRDAVHAVAEDDPDEITPPLATLGFLPTLVTTLMGVGERHDVLAQELDTAARLYRYQLQGEWMRRG